MTDHSARNRTSLDTARHAAAKSPNRVAKSAMHTLPILLAGTITISLNMTAPVQAATVKKDDKPKDSNEQLRTAIATAMQSAANERAQSGAAATSASGQLVVAATEIAPSSYRVTAGDTVSSIAARYALSTASVLALNGLGWQSLIFPGQVLQLTDAISTSTATQAPTPSAPASAATKYTIALGDTISAIASRFGVSTQDILTANQLGWATIIYPGQTISIPGAVPQNPSSSVDAPSAEVEPVSSVTPISESTGASSSYLIVSGDTITSIASSFGLSVQSILDANGLDQSSIIFAGRTLTIPQPQSSTAGLGTEVTPLTAEMTANAKTIIEVGTSLGVNDYGLAIALATAMQESGLRNLNYGDLDSLGLFQQRPSTGWGTADQVTDTVYASRLFFGGPNNPNAQNTRGLLDIVGWQAMSVTQASQAVQLSAYPDAYAKWEISARAWLSQLR